MGRKLIYFFIVSASVKWTIKSGSCKIAIATESSLRPGEDDIIFSMTSGLFVKR